MKYILLISIMLFSSCGGRVNVIRSKDTTPVNPAPVTQFNDVDTDQDGAISPREFAEVKHSTNEIDISTPLNAFCWVVLAIITVCVLATWIPRYINHLRCRRLSKKCHTDDNDKQTLLNE